MSLNFYILVQDEVADIEKEKEKTINDRYQWW